MNLFSGCCIFFFADHTSVLCSSFVYLRILIPCRQRNYRFWHNISAFFSLILHIFTRAAAFFLAIFFLIYYSFFLISLRQKYQIKYNIKLLFAIHAEVQRCQISLMKYIVEFLLFAEKLFIICILTGWKKIRSLLSGVWKFLGSIVKISLL